MDTTTLARYADAIVRDGLQIGPGDLLAVHGDPAHRDLVVALAEAGYRAGASHVDSLSVDPRVTKARALGADPGSLDWRPGWEDERMRAIVEANGGIVWLIGAEEPELMADVPPTAASTTVFERPGLGPYREAVAAAKARFVVASYPTPAWAESVFPELPPEQALEHLWADVLSFARLGPDDPADGWRRHTEMLEARATVLSGRELRTLRLCDEHTDLRVTLPAGASWKGGRLLSHGQGYSPNIPTEEVFTSPDPLGTEGIFCCSRPLEIAGRVIEGIRGEFAAGALVRIDAARAADAEFLRAYLARDEGAGRLGEVALVDAGSRIGQAGRAYRTTLLDENAASHVAFGFGFGFCREPGAPAPNVSSIHVDVMIGTPAMEVTATDVHGSEHLVMRAGAFA